MTGADLERATRRNGRRPPRRRPSRGLAAALGALAVWSAACASAGPVAAPGSTGAVGAAGTASDEGGGDGDEAVAADGAGSERRADSEAAAVRPAAAGEAAAPSVPAIYSEPQATRGRRVFEETCSECHATGEFRGTAFRSNWGRRTVYSFFRTVRSTMPDNNPGGLEEQVYLDVVAYVLKMNGHAAGQSELVADSPMRDVRIGSPGSGP